MLTEKKQLDPIHVVVKISQKEFTRLGDFIYKEFGIRMPNEKQVMLQSRLQKRIKELKMDSFSQYIDFLFSKEGQGSELIEMVNLVSTNKTDFFRESQHFDILVNTILPAIQHSGNVKRVIRLWSSASSSGEEAYTIAMVMSNWIEQNPGFDYSIFGTDISTKVLKQAIEGVYRESSIYPISMAFKKKYLLKHKDPTEQKVRIVPELRTKCAFKRLNLMDPVYNVEGNFDVVFCRNVLIYFDHQTQERVINKLCGKLRTGGYFFLGHSESIMQMDVPLKQVKPTVFIKS